MTGFLPIVQIVLSVLLITLVLMQQNEAALGTAFGDADAGALHRTRRGAELIIFYLTIGVAVLFAFSSVLALLLQR